MPKRSDRRPDLLRAIQAVNGEWINRNKLAFETGKSKLSPNDITWLANLERDGLIEVRKQPTESQSGYEWEYRLRSE